MRLELVQKQRNSNMAKLTSSQYKDKDDDLVDKSSSVKDAIFGHKLAYRYKRKTEFVLCA